MAKEKGNYGEAPGAGSGPQELASSSGSHPVVFLCDPERDRRKAIVRLIEGKWSTIRTIEAVAPSDACQLSPFDGVALVAVIGGSSPEQPATKAISVCKSEGFTVVAYADGVKEWSMRAKCLPLLAGATHLLDSANEDFTDELGRLMEQAFQALAGKNCEEQEISNLMRTHQVVGESPAFRMAFRQAMRFSELSDLPVLITGESGTGKELLAKAISKMDPKRKNGPFVAINCAAINHALMESEFFGHRRGAFTGAERDRKGLVRSAQGGVLFLDEIGELDLGLQAKLLRVLQEHRVLTLGDELESPVDVRFIAATNQDLEQLVAERRFRADLYHRLRVLCLHIPPLRERPKDIPFLVLHFLQKSRRLQTESTMGASEDYLEAVRQLNLPGNVRQLENLVYHSLAQHQTTNALDLTDLPSEVLRQIASRNQVGAPVEDCADTYPRAVLRELSQPEMNDLVKRILDGRGWNLSTVLRECERQVVEVAMKRTGGNQSQAARLLGITARSVYNKVHKFRLHS